MSPTPQSSSPISKETVNVTQGLIELQKALRQKGKATIYYEDQVIELNTRSQCILENGKPVYKPRHQITEVGHLIGEGENKALFLIANGKALALISKENDRTAYEWHHLALNEVLWSKHLKKVGIECLSQERVVVKFNDQQIPALLMPNFLALVNQGIQVRDGKDMFSSYGNSFLSLDSEDYVNPDFLKNSFQGIMQDIIILLNNDLPEVAAYDSMHIVIKDTAQTPHHDRNQVDTIGNRKQEIRLFFYDLSDLREAHDSITKPNTTLASRAQQKERATKLLDKAFHAFGVALSMRADKITGTDQHKLMESLYQTLQTMREQLLQDIMQQVTIKTQVAQKNTGLMNGMYNFFNSILGTKKQNTPENKGPKL